MATTLTWYVTLAEMHRPCAYRSDYLPSHPSFQSGGAIYIHGVESTVTIMNSRITDNSAYWGGGATTQISGHLVSKGNLIKNNILVNPGYYGVANSILSPGLRCGSTCAAGTYGNCTQQHDLPDGCGSCVIGECHSW